MQVTIATTGKFHLFDLARQLFGRDMLSCIFTGYPRFKLKNEKLPASKIKCFSVSHMAELLAHRQFGSLSPISKKLTWLDKQVFDGYVAGHLGRPDVYIGHSCVGLKSGAAAKRAGALYVCDRGSSHIRYQNDILRSEYSRHGLNFEGIDERVIAKEEKEYALADMIFLPSTFAYNTFCEMGVAPEKLKIIPYGVDVQRFAPAGRPSDESFDVLFAGNASIRKGVPYLISAFEQLSHPKKSLTFVGTRRPEIEPILREAATRLPIQLLGHLPQAELAAYMNRSHVMVLPSVEEGLALVQAQAMACGCPVIGTTNTGADDLFTDGVEGFVVAPRSSEAIASRLQQLADEPALRARMSARAAAKVRQLGGWQSYADTIVDSLERATGGHVLAEAMH